MEVVLLALQVYITCQCQLNHVMLRLLSTPAPLRALTTAPLPPPVSVAIASTHSRRSHLGHLLPLLPTMNTRCGTTNTWVAMCRLSISGSAGCCVGNIHNSP